MKYLIAVLLFAILGLEIHQHLKSREVASMTETPKKIVTANEFQLVDASGRLRASLTASADGVSLSMAGTEGKTHIKLMVDSAGLSFLKLFDSSSEEAKVDISLDDKGTHLFLAGDGKQQSYLFLKKGGASGVVLVDREGTRRAQLLLNADGEPNATLYPRQGPAKSL